MKTNALSLFGLTLVICFLSHGKPQAQGSQTAKNPTHATKPIAGIFDELVELFPDSRLNNPNESLTVEVARGTIAGAHLLLTDLHGTKSIRFSLSNSSGGLANVARWYRMIDVPVTENTGLDRCTEKYSGMLNPFVIRRAPFRIFDPFAPASSPMDVDSSTVALRLEIPIDSTITPGKYSFKIRIDFDTATEIRELVVGVHRAVVPPTSRSTISYVNWHTLDNICRDHGVEKWGEPFWEMLKTYAELMVHGRQNTFWFLWRDFFTFDDHGNVVAFRRDLLERYIRTFLHAGMHTIQGAPIAGRRSWSSSDMLLTVELPGGRSVDATSDEGKRMLSAMAIRISATMKENGWEKRWLQGIFDEPTDEFVDRYKELAALLRASKPDIQILEATMTVELSGVVTVWCPQVQEYQAHREFFDGRRAAGDKVWVYTCLVPGGPWLNRLCDQERLRQVYFGWACARFNLQGFLHWGLNFHSGQPFEVLVRPHGEKEFLPAGDSHILYPRKDGPLSSHRFEAHRMGMEDYELLSLLRLKNSSQADQIIGQVFQAFDQYSKDVTAYRKAKQLLMESLDND